MDPILNTLKTMRGLARPVFAVFILTSTVCIAHSQSSKEKVLVLIAQAEESCLINDLPGAMRFYGKAFDLAQKDKDLDSLEKIAQPLINYYLDEGSLDAALARSEQLLETARFRKDPVQEGWALDFIGNVRFYQARYDAAFQAFEDANSLMKASADLQGEAATAKDLGIVLKYLRRFDEAFEYLYRALEIFRQLNNRSGIMSSLNNIASGYRSIGYTRQAIHTYQQMIKMAEEDGNDFELCFAFNNLGILQTELLDFTSALESFQRAWEKTERTNIPQHQKSFILQCLSWANFKLGNTDEAVSLQRQALPIIKKLGNAEQEALYYGTLGWIHLETEPQKALANFKKALGIAMRNRLPYRYPAYQGLAETYKKMGDLDKAIEFSEKAIAETETIRNLMGSDQRRSAFTGRKQYQYQTLIESLYMRAKASGEMQDEEQAFAVAESAKAMALLEALFSSRLEVDRTLPPDLLERKNALSRRISEQQKELMTIKGDKDKSLLDELRQTEHEFERLIAEIKTREPRYSAAFFPQPLTVKQTQELLDSGTAILEFAVLRGVIIGFVVTRDQFRLFEVPVTPVGLDSRIQNYVDLLGRDDEGWKAVSVRLEKELIAPARGLMDGKIRNLVIVPDGTMNYLPFETLVVEQTDRFLIEDFAVSYAPSATVYAQLRSEEVTATNEVSALIVASPKLPRELLAISPISERSNETMRTLLEFENLQLSSLPGGIEEALAIAGIIGERTTVLSESKASEQVLKSTDLLTYNILHFATHGLVSLEAPERSSLLLTTEGENDGEDGLLQAREVYQLKISSSLVTLSACQTARGQILQGEGVRSLAQAFIYAGSRSVVASLWDVEDKMAVKFMSAFYANLRLGQSKSEGLRNAKLDMIETNRGVSPKSWSAFILVGDDQGRIQIERVGSRPTGYFPAGILVAVLLILLASQARRRWISLFSKRTS